MAESSTQEDTSQRTGSDATSNQDLQSETQTFHGWAPLRWRNVPTYTQDGGTRLQQTSRSLRCP